MGCGSSAAVRLAGVALAAHFGGLGWDREHILAEATNSKGIRTMLRPAGWVASLPDVGTERTCVRFRFPRLAAWRALVVLPEKPLATSASRAVLPTSYERADVVANLQRVAVLTAAFATARGELIAEAMRDRMHQPYRSKACPLLPRLLPLSGTDGILGVCLSGAGPAVLVLVEAPDATEAVKAVSWRRSGGWAALRAFAAAGESACGNGLLKPIPPS